MQASTQSIHFDGPIKELREKVHGSTIQPVTDRKRLHEILYRNGEPYKAISLKGLKYGVNSIRTDYPDTLLPVWYSDTFPKLVELIEEPDPYW